MNSEVVVVGGGIGGLTVAALLAQRGVDVCLLERDSRVGGCAASIEKFGYSFESGYGLFTAWEPDEIHARVFSELPVESPEVRRWDPAFVVRLPDQSEISLVTDTDQFEAELRRTFPECADVAVRFYREATAVGDALRRALQRSPDFLSAPKSSRILTLLREGRLATEIMRSGKTTVDRLAGASLRFRRFIDGQLQVLAQGNSAEVPYLGAALALSGPRGGMFALRGGADALANSLADSIKKSGGRIRLDTPVLRLSYSSSGDAVGVDLLSGETVKASQAVVSNLTTWDTYGKLVGLNRTPAEIRKHLGALRGWGAYLMYLGLNDTTTPLSADHVFTLADWQPDDAFSPETQQLVFAAAPPWDSRAPQGQRAVTVRAFTEVNDWFTFHRDETELEAQDQQMLEQCWARLHAAMPELGDRVEVIETATPRSFYDGTRRKLGMVGGVVPSPESFWLTSPSCTTSLPNLFIVSDTTSFDGIAGLTRSAFALAGKLTSR